jgi:Ca2+-binding EF-hand superfamily protein
LRSANFDHQTIARQLSTRDSDDSGYLGLDELNAALRALRLPVDEELLDTLKTNLPKDEQNRVDGKLLTTCLDPTTPIVDFDQETSSIDAADVLARVFP